MYLSFLVLTRIGMERLASEKSTKKGLMENGLSKTI